MPSLFEMSFSKALNVNGVPHVFLKCSDTRVDRQYEEMEQGALEDMLQFFKSGNVTLIDNHSSSFEMGHCVDGEIIKGSDGALELVAEIAMNMSHPFSDTLYKEVEAGTCKRGGSVGGRAKGARYYNTSLQKEVRRIVHVTDLEHIAVTRPNRSAVASAEFVGAIMKSVDWDGTPVENKNNGDITIVDPKEFEKALTGFNEALALQKTTIDTQAAQLQTATTALNAAATATSNIDLAKSLGEFKTANIDPLSTQIGDMVKAMGTLIELNGTIVAKLNGAQPRIAQPAQATGTAADFLKGLGIGTGGADDETDEQKAFKKSVDDAQAEFNVIKGKIDAGIQLSDDDQQKRQILGSRMLQLQIKGAKFDYGK